MLTFRDCLDLAAVTEEEVAAIARHERIPLMVALELGAHLLRQPGGLGELRGLFVEAVREAQARHHCAECTALSRVLDRFLASHPDCPDGAPEQADEVLGLTAIGRVAAHAPTSGDRPPDAGVVADAIAAAREHGDCRMCAKLSQLLTEMLARDAEPETGTAGSS